MSRPKISKVQPYQFTVFPNLTHVHNTVLDQWAKGKMDDDVLHNLEYLIKFAKAVERNMPMLVEAIRQNMMLPGFKDAVEAIMKAGDPKWEL